MTRVWRTILPVVVLSSVSASAQERPNFTGTWQEDTGSPASVNNETIVQQGPEMKIATRGSSNYGSIGVGRSDDRSFRTDGTELYSATGRLESWVTVNWQGGTLVFLRVLRDGLRVTVRRESWTLSDDGNTLTKLRRTIDPEGVSNEKVVFHRQ
jgi:hypothetical protein